MPRDSSVSLAELGEHIGDLRRIHRAALDDKADVPEVSFADIRARCHAIIAMLDKADTARTSDADPVDGSPIHGHDSMPLSEAFLGATNSQRKLAAARALGSVDARHLVGQMLDNTHIRSPELHSRKLKK